MKKLRNHEVHNHSYPGYCLIGKKRNGFIIICSAILCCLEHFEYVVVSICLFSPLFWLTQSQRLIPNHMHYSLEAVAEVRRTKDHPELYVFLSVNVVVASCQNALKKKTTAKKMANTKEDAQVLHVVNPKSFPSQFRFRSTMEVIEMANRPIRNHC